jgi:phosphate-selective porin OprO/OprP
VTRARIRIGSRLCGILAGIALACGAARAANDQELSDESDSRQWWRDVDVTLPGVLTDWRVYHKDGLRIDAVDKRLRLKLNANLWGDAGDIDASNAIETAFPGIGGSTARVTRARLILRGWLYDSGDFKLQLELAQNPQIKDAWFRFNPVPYFGRIRVGNMREPFSLDNSTSGGNLTFLSRALPTLAFAPGRNIGIAVQNTAFDERLTWAAGWFWNTASFSDFADAKDALSESIGNDVTVRVTGLSRYADEGRELVHLGLSVSHQHYNRNSRIRAVPETALIDDNLVDTGEFQPERALLIAPELALVAGPWSFQAEYFDTALRLSAAGSAQLKGAYASASYVFTGESRHYDRAAGVFDGVRPRRKFAFGSGGWGAWEAALRLSHVNLNDGTLSGGRQTDLTAALNWYINNHSRLMLNYVYGRVKDRGHDPALDEGRLKILQARFAIDF